MANTDEYGFYDFTDWNECVRYYDENVGGGSDNNTHLMTEFETVPNLMQYVTAMNKATGQKEKAGIVNSYVTTILKDAAPMRVGLFMLSDHIFTKCARLLNQKEFEPIIKLVKQSKTVEETKPDELKTYKDAVILFREMATTILPGSVFNSPMQDAGGVIRVSGKHLIPLGNMLTTMIQKRKKALGVVQNLGGKKKQYEGESYGASHYMEYYDYITSGENFGHANLKARCASGDGIITNECPKQGNKGGPLLLSTALEQHLRFNKINPDDFDTVNPIMMHAVEEVKKMREGNNTTQDKRSDYFQQCANMDIFFNFFLQIKAFNVDVVENKKNRKMLNIFLNMLGQKIIGKTKIVEKLQKFDLMKTIVKNLNKKGSKYIPPYAITESRIYDWVAVFGVLRVGELKLMSMSPGISTRFFTHFKLISSVAMEALVSFNLLENEADNSGDIRESEHLLHQMLLRKDNAYQHGLNVKGNVFDIQLEAI